MHTVSMLTVVGGGSYSRTAQHTTLAMRRNILHHRLNWRHCFFYLPSSSCLCPSVLVCFLHSRIVILRSFRMQRKHTHTHAHIHKTGAHIMPCTYDFYSSHWDPYEQTVRFRRKFDEQAGSKTHRARVIVVAIHGRNKSRACVCVLQTTR